MLVPNSASITLCYEHTSALPACNPTTNGGLCFCITDAHVPYLPKEFHSDLEPASPCQADSHGSEGAQVPLLWPGILTERKYGGPSTEHTLWSGTALCSLLQGICRATWSGGSFQTQWPRSSRWVAGTCLILTIMYDNDFHAFGFMQDYGISSVLANGDTAILDEVIQQ